MIIALSSARAITEARAAAADYASKFQDGPALNSFNGKPAAEQLKTAVRMIRSGDCLLHVMRSLPQTHELAQAAGGLDQQMRACIARALVYERPGKVQDEAHGARVLKDLVGYTANTIHSEAIIDKVFGAESPYKSMWEPLKVAVETQISAGKDAMLADMITRLKTVEDDNDLACVISSARRWAVGEYLGSFEEAQGDLVYTLAKCDCEVMQGSMTMSREDYLESEVAAYERLEPKPGKGLKSPGL